MAAWNTSSLAFSNGSHELPRVRSGLLKNFTSRLSKQQMVERKMFNPRKGKRGKSLKVSKKFSGGIKHPRSSKSSGISPSVGEFDRMMANVSGRNKKPSISRKFFG